MNCYVSYSYSLCYFLIEKYGFDTFQRMMKKEFPSPLPDNYVGVLINEFYGKSLLELETDFTNYISHYEYQNEYLKKPEERKKLEENYLKWKSEAENPTNQTKK
ncbi:MAG: hypothetical protein A2Y33_04115 [Spirochaetes bacterium GWF1_51_8]|nr:MAG: hypothetical protein A2Y33_04115 [Spirochaetes bacterium GWF1_51_8]